MHAFAFYIKLKHTYVCIYACTWSVSDYSDDEKYTLSWNNTRTNTPTQNDKNRFECLFPVRHTTMIILLRNNVNWWDGMMCQNVGLLPVFIAAIAVRSVYSTMSPVNYCGGCAHTPLQQLGLGGLTERLITPLNENARPTTLSPCTCHARNEYSGKGIAAAAACMLVKKK